MLHSLVVNWVEFFSSLRLKFPEISKMKSRFDCEIAYLRSREYNLKVATSLGNAYFLIMQTMQL